MLRRDPAGTWYAEGSKKSTEGKDIIGAGTHEITETLLEKPLLFLRAILVFLREMKDREMKDVPARDLHCMLVALPPSPSRRLKKPNFLVTLVL